MSKELIEQSDYIFALSLEHQRGVIGLSDEAAEKCVLLDEGGDIADPIGGGREAYNSCGRTIEKIVKNRIYEL